MEIGEKQLGANVEENHSVSVPIVFEVAEWEYESWTGHWGL